MKKLTKKDKELLKEFGYCNSEINDIEQRLPYLRLYLYDYSTDKEKRVSRKFAIDSIGKYNFLSGLGRSAFHWSASRSIEGTSYVVNFDMNKFFRS